MSAENLWRVEIINKDQTGDGVWHSIGSQVRLIHEKSKQALKYSGRVYPDWGFHQNEVVCDKIHNQLDAIWNVEEHRYTKDDADKNSIEKELFQAELIPEEPTELSFMEKFVELQIKMLVTNQENVQNHNYASDPSEWPFLTRGIAYFISKTSNVSQKTFHLLVFSFIFVQKSISRLKFTCLATLSYGTLAQAEFWSTPHCSYSTYFVGDAFATTFQKVYTFHALTFLRKPS